MVSSLHDDLENEGLDPDRNLIDARRIREEEDYRSWCENTFGMVEVGQEVFHPADVLDKLAPDASRRGRADASAQVRTDLEMNACEQFPSPIAIPFHAFLEGPRPSITRLHRLRDTWESLVRLLAALALSEATRFSTLLAPLVLRDGKDQGWRECKRRDLYSDKLSVRTGLIEGVLHRAANVGINLRVASLIPVEVFEEIRRLNNVRNGFSHEATKSEEQARIILDEAYPVVRDLLLDLREMQFVELFRIHSMLPGSHAEVERLSGHAQSRRIEVVTLDAESASLALAATPVDGMSRVLARIDGITLDLGPFVYAADDETGHRTRVFQFKSRKEQEWQMECVADSTTISSPSVQHESLLGPFDALLQQSGGQ